MRYAAQLNGQSDVLEKVAPCFVGDDARIRRDGDVWVLESSAFEHCTTGQKVFPIADAVLSRVHQIVALYLGPYSPFSVHSILWINAEGKPKHSLRAVQKIFVYSPKGLQKLSTYTGTLPLGSVIAHCVATDPAVAEALSLVGECEPRWSQIYDIIEFLGGPKGVQEAGLADKKLTRHIKRTANHYRHLSSRKAYPLPANPSTLSKAHVFVVDLLQRWIATRL